MSEASDDKNSEQSAEERQARRLKWKKGVGYTALAAAGLVAAEALRRRFPIVAEVAEVAVKKTVEYAPRPNKDVSGQARDALGRWVA